MKRFFLIVLLIACATLIVIGLQNRKLNEQKPDGQENANRIYNPPPPPLAQQDKDNPNRYYFSVPANVMWADTGIVVGGRKFRIQENPGGYWVWDNFEEHHVTAKGSTGDHLGTIVEKAPLASLVGTVLGGTTKFYVGEHFQSVVQPETAGTLRLSCNDVPGAFVDNQGAIKVVIDLE